MRVLLALFALSSTLLGQGAFSFGDAAFLSKDSQFLQGLVSSWNFNESGTGTRYDQKGSNHLTSNAGVTQNTNGISDSCASFVATSSQYFSCASNSSLQTGDIDYTWNWWLKLTSVPASGIVFVNKGNSGTSKAEYQMYIPAGETKLHFIILSGTGSSILGNVTNSVNMELSRWYMATCTYDTVNNRIVCGIDNTFVTNTASISPGTNTEQLTIGRNWTGNGYMNGQIDEVRFWKRALTETEALAIWKLGYGSRFSRFDNAFGVGQPYPYVFPTFNGTTETFRLLVSNDGIKFGPVANASYSATPFRDPAIWKTNDIYWMAYTQASLVGSGATNPTTTFGLAKSTNLLNWSFVTNVDCSGISGVHTIWGPIPFSETNGAFHILLSASQSTNTGNFKQYYIDPTATDFTTWGTPTEIGGVATAYPNTIAGYIVQKSGTNYMWVKDENGKCTVVLSSTSPLTGYGTYKSGDWAGWGCGLYEAAYLFQIGSTWRVYFDKYNDLTGEYFSESTDDWVTWSTPLRVVAPYVTRSGYILRQ